MLSQLKNKIIIIIIFNRVFKSPSPFAHEWTGHTPRTKTDKTGNDSIVDHLVWLDYTLLYNRAQIQIVRHRYHRGTIDSVNTGDSFSKYVKNMCRNGLKKLMLSHIWT